MIDSVEVNGIIYDIEDLKVIKLVLVRGQVIADFTPSTGILNQHYLDEYTLPEQVLAKLTGK